jgi:hypothetical protein
MTPLRRDFGDCDWPVPGERSVRSCGHPHRIERRVPGSDWAAIANESDERIDLGHIGRAEAI